jgi:hypothetical protein
MKIFKPSDSVHSMHLIPRFQSDIIDLIIHDELKDEQTTIQGIETYCDNGYMFFEFQYTFREGGSYSMTVESDTLIWRGKAYATNETDLENYKLNG